MSPTILLVDDERLIRWSVAARLKAEDYDVLEAHSGRSAREHLSAAFDVMLLDRRLPDTDGLMLLRQLKTLKPAIPVILITSDASRDFNEEAIRLGAHDVLGKPFDLDDVARAVSGALGCRRSAP
jgi:DNA-binding NtrC family response regulator